MTDKWTMGSNNEGLYNGINPSCKRKKKKKRKKGKRKEKRKRGDQETTTVASREHNLKEFILSQIKPLGFNYNSLKPPKPHSSDIKS